MADKDRTLFELWNTLGYRDSSLWQISNVTSVGKVFRDAIATVYEKSPFASTPDSKAGRSTPFNIRFIQSSDFSNFWDMISIRKVLNPLNILEAATLFFANIGDVLGRKLVKGTNTSFWRKLARGAINIFFASPYLLIRPITSPARYLINPVVEFTKEHPYLSALIVLGVIATAGLVAASIFTGGIPIIAAAASFVAVNIPFLSAAAPAVAVVVTNAGFVSLQQHSV